MLDNLAKVILVIGRNPGSTDISVESIWPDIRLTCKALIRVVVGQLVAIGYGGLPFFWLLCPSSASDHPGLQVGPVLLLALGL